MLNSYKYILNTPEERARMKKLWYNWDMYRINAKTKADKLMFQLLNVPHIKVAGRNTFGGLMSYWGSRATFYGALATLMFGIFSFSVSFLPDYYKLLSIIPIVFVIYFGLKSWACERAMGICAKLWE